ncbi:MAG TPA: DUF1844 domain-containing protein [Pyrinomonadaceae bacterium]|nr:DUF1844 domain-containing protein [Pyrinomonadaceae bacterium]
MSEEQPVFKVTDRRLFNPDGTPREIEREPEAKAETPASETTPPASAAENARPSSAAAPPLPVESGAESGMEASAAASAQKELPEDDYAESEIPGADDPASFINFLMSIASNAAAALGMMEHPVTGQRSVDPELAKHWIDVLGMLQQKTKGNLAPQEHQIFEGLLADLRMQYVSLSGARPQPKGPRGFTGKDIIGGR